MLRQIEEVMATIVVEDETETVANDLQALVKEAARRMDEMQPGWYERVNTRRLFMPDASKCILGQSFYGDGDDPFQVGWNKLEAFGDRDLPRFCVPGMIAATVPLGYAFSSDQRLTDFWKEEIRARKRA